MSNYILSCQTQNRIKRLSIEWMNEVGTPDGLEAYLQDIAPHPSNPRYKIWVAEVAIAVNAIAPDPAPTLGSITYAPNADGQLCLLL